jgi:hypothetical protein
VIPWKIIVVAKLTFKKFIGYLTRGRGGEWRFRSSIGYLNIHSFASSIKISLNQNVNACPNANFIEI